MTNINLDASGEKLGRLATKAATFLMGKNQPSYQRNAFPKTTVMIKNASKLDITEKKISEITHTRYSGYPGGIRKYTGKKVAADKGYGELIRHAVSRMLPKNKHRATMLKNLKISE